MRYKEVFVKNLPLKFLSLLLAFLLWVMVSGEKRQRVEIMVRAPIGFQNLPKNLELISFSPKEVKIRLRVQKNLMFSQDYRSISVMVDLSGAKEGEEIFSIKKDMVILPEDVEVVKISPSYVRVKLEAIIQKTVKIKPVLLGSPPPWFEFKGYKLVPSQAIISGTKSAIYRVKRIYTEPFNLKELKPSEPVRLKLIPPREAIAIISPEDGMVNLFFEGRERKERKEIKKRVGNYLVEITLEGLHSQVSPLGPEVIKNIERSGRRLVPVLELPEGVRMVKFRITRERR